MLYMVATKLVSRVCSLHFRTCALIRYQVTTFRNVMSLLGHTALWSYGEATKQ
jgi:hypothetical protein